MHTPLCNDLLACETAVWEALRAGDAVADAAALHADFIGVYSDGFAGKSDHVRQLDGGPTIASFALLEPRALPLGSDHASLSYRVAFTRIGQVEPEVMFVTSIWQRAGTGWVNLLSQDTPAAP